MARKQDYYQELGVPRTADEKEIRQAYRKLARRYHPDLNPDDKKAEERFKRVNEAHEVLSNADSRGKYDRYGENWKNADRIESATGGFRSPFTRRRRGGTDPGGFGGPFADIEDLIGQNPFGRRGRTPTATRIEASVDVSLEEAIAGTTRTVTVTANGSERRLEVTIPPGVKTGSVVRFSPGEGPQLHLNIKVASHGRFTRRGDDLYTEVEVPLEDAVLGGEVEVQTLRRKVSLTVPPESQNGQKIRLKGQGMPRLGSPNTVGNLFVTVRPQMPKNISEEELDLFRNLKKLRNKDS